MAGQAPRVSLPHLRELVGMYGGDIVEKLTLNLPRWHSVGKKDTTYTQTHKCFASEIVLSLRTLLTLYVRDQDTLQVTLTKAPWCTIGEEETVIISIFFF